MCSTRSLEVQNDWMEKRGIHNGPVTRLSTTACEIVHRKYPLVIVVSTQSLSSPRPTEPHFERGQQEEARAMEERLSTTPYEQKEPSLYSENAIP